MSARRLAFPLALLSIVFALNATTRAQLPDPEERLKILTDPEGLKKKGEKDKSRPPLELFRTQVAPFDVLPFVKPNHWSTISLEMRANYNDYAGSLQTSPVMLRGLPQEIVYRRDARLVKTQRTRLGMQVMLPRVPKEINLELLQPDAIRPDEGWAASLRVLEAHQMLIVFLTKESNDAFASWNRFQALYPDSVERGDVQAMDRMRYYRLVLPLEPDRPPLSSHPLTWTTISHVVWDGMPPDTLNPGQQEAMLDWLHWGGQLVLLGGAGPSFNLLQDSFLSPYLPADPTGENALLARGDLTALSAEYPPPLVAVNRDGDDEAASHVTEPVKRLGDRYRVPVPIKPKADRPVFLAGLKPKPGSVGIPLGESGTRMAGVERRVGRGRVLMLGFNPTDPAMAAWPGLDTFVRRVVLRRPEDSRAGRSVGDGRGAPTPQFGALPGPDLTWVRYLSRDMGSPRPRDEVIEKTTARKTTRSNRDETPTDDQGTAPESADYQTPDAAVAEWIDAAALPLLCRDALEEASGIKVPSSLFVLKVVLAYVLALVPLNWLICRYLLGRRELAWVVVPLLSFGFAFGVERAAAYDMGYNSACDEIDVVESYGGYPRAHVSRFSSLYSTGRTRFSISFPNDPTALALPFNTGRSLRGEDVVTSVWQSYPVPALEGFLVQPRSLGMVRAEQMITLDGPVSLVSDASGRKVVNGGSLALQDAVLVDVSGPAGQNETYLGAIGPGATVEVKAGPRPPPGASGADALRPQRFLKEFRHYHEDRPENQGEIRLVAWTPRPLVGQKIEPVVDRHRGFTAFVVHLKNGPPPPPGGLIYNELARRSEPPGERAETPPQPAGRTPVMPGTGVYPRPGMIPPGSRDGGPRPLPGRPGRR